MPAPDSARPLSPTAHQVLAAVTAQLGRFDEAVRGLCVRGEVVHTKHGRIGPIPPDETVDERLDDPDAEDAAPDLLPFLAGDAYERHECPAPDPQHICVRATRRPGADRPVLSGADLTFTVEPPALVRVEAHAPEVSGVMRIVVERFESEVRYAYVNGVPLPTRLQTRLRSRGLGRLRFDQEMQATLRYVPCGR